jgi:hypothetical protein
VLQLIDNFTASRTVEALLYSESTNKYGEKTVISNSITEVTTVIPDVTSGLKYITTKYPAITADHIDLIHTVEYPSFYQSKVTVETDTTNQVTIVVNIDKQTKSVTEMGTYSSSDVVHATNSAANTTSPTTTSSPAVNVASYSPAIIDVVKFIESSKDISVNDIKTITKSTSV